MLILYNLLLPHRRSQRVVNLLGLRSDIEDEGCGSL